MNNSLAKRQLGLAMHKRHKLPIVILYSISITCSLFIISCKSNNNFVDSNQISHLKANNTSYVLFPKTMNHSYFQCKKVKLEDTWEMFKGALSCQDLTVRKKVLDQLSQRLKIEKKKKSHRQSSELEYLIASLKLAMISENGQYQYLTGGQSLITNFQHSISQPSKDIQRLFFLNTILIEQAMAENNWRKALSIARKSLLKARDGPNRWEYALMSASYIGMPLVTNLPQTVINNFERSKCSRDIQECVPLTELAPFGQLGFTYELAEAYARVGDKENAKKYLQLLTKEKNFISWAYREQVLSNIKHLNQFVGRFNRFNKYQGVNSLLNIRGNHNCIACHHAKLS
ncbi:hypothetical protein [Parashewanella tropica]|uniref:hypothetical protein n=1 Tax=Parashewanella tropica TaxID=2547970 RepID=UPI00105A109F|nr:hypothetical protein [Parashewanella tropica]